MLFHICHCFLSIFHSLSSPSFSLSLSVYLSFYPSIAELAGGKRTGDVTLLSLIFPLPSFQLTPPPRFLHQRLSSLDHRKYLPEDHHYPPPSLSLCLPPNHHGLSVNCGDATVTKTSAPSSHRRSETSLRLKRKA